MARSSTSAWIFGLLCGAALGVLFAPRKGSDLRKKILDARSEGDLGIAPLKNDLQQVATDLANTAKDIYKTSKLGDILSTTDFSLIPNEAVMESNFEKHPLKKTKKAVRKQAKKQK